MCQLISPANVPAAVGMTAYSNVVPALVCTGSLAAALVSTLLQPAAWTVFFALETPAKRAAVAYWIALLAATLPVMHRVASLRHLPTIILRKARTGDSLQDASVIRSLSAADGALVWPLGRSSPDCMLVTSAKERQKVCLGCGHRCCLGVHHVPHCLHAALFPVQRLFCLHDDSCC